MESFRQDIRLGVRLLLKQPAFSLLAIVTLGLGIGASVALFSVLDAAFIRPLPYPNPEQLVEIHVQRTDPSGEVSTLDPSAIDVEDWRRHGGLFSHLGTTNNDFTTPLILDGEEPQRLLAERVTREYFPMLGISPFIGRDFRCDRAPSTRRFESGPQHQRRQYAWSCGNPVETDPRVDFHSSVETD